MGQLDATANGFIGKGLIFPILLNNQGRPDIGSGKELLESSFKNILSWAPGIRYMLGEYGTKLEQLLQEPNDDITRSLVKHFTVEVIEQWEKRVEVLDVKFLSREEHKLNIQITYRVKNTKIQDSFIFPYYSQIIY